MHGLEVGESSSSQKENSLPREFCMHASSHMGHCTEYSTCHTCTIFHVDTSIHHNGGRWWPNLKAIAERCNVPEYCLLTANTDLLQQVSIKQKKMGTVTAWQGMLTHGLALLNCSMIFRYDSI